MLARLRAILSRWFGAFSPYSQVSKHVLEELLEAIALKRSYILSIWNKLDLLRLLLDILALTGLRGSRYDPLVRNTLACAGPPQTLEVGNRDWPPRHSQGHRDWHRTAFGWTVQCGHSPDPAGYHLQCAQHKRVR